MKIPLYELGPVRRKVFPFAKQGARATPASFGGGQAEDLARVGQVAQQVGQQLASTAVQLQRQQGTEEFRSAMAGFQAELDPMLKEIEGLDDEQMLLAREALKPKIDAMIGKARGQLQNEYAKSLFGPAAEQRGLMALRRVDHYVMRPLERRQAMTRVRTAVGAVSETVSVLERELLQTRGNETEKLGALFDEKWQQITEKALEEAQTDRERDMIRQTIQSIGLRARNRVMDHVIGELKRVEVGSLVQSSERLKDLAIMSFAADQSAIAESSMTSLKANIAQLYPGNPAGAQKAFEGVQDFVHRSAALRIETEQGAIAAEAYVRKAPMSEEMRNTLLSTYVKMAEDEVVEDRVTVVAQEAMAEGTLEQQVAKVEALTEEGSEVRKTAIAEVRQQWGIKEQVAAADVRAANLAALEEFAEREATMTISQTAELVDKPGSTAASRLELKNDLDGYIVRRNARTQRTFELEAIAEEYDDYVQDPTGWARKDLGSWTHFGRTGHVMLSGWQQSILKAERDGTHDRVSEAMREARRVYADMFPVKDETTRHEVRRWNLRLARALERIGKRALGFDPEAWEPGISGVRMAYEVLTDPVLRGREDRPLTAEERRSLRRATGVPEQSVSVMRAGKQMFVVAGTALPLLLSRYNIPKTIRQAGVLYPVVSVVVNQQGVPEFVVRSDGFELPINVRRVK